jgi:UDP:flavonoid glycosyltransferase YjiC (YdhE family)
MIALLPHCGFLSETTRMLAIGQALVARGQPVVFATHGGP